MTCGYLNRKVLVNASHDFPKGQITVLLGPNGSGKSTLLKTISRIIAPLAGEILIGDRNLKSYDADELGRTLALVPQEEQFQFAFTARQVVLMGRLPHSPGFRDSDHDHEVVERCMSQADCHGFADRSVLELSGGERQRVLIARALAQEPKVLLLDEPISHLDVGHQVALISLLRNLASEGTTVIAAVHDLNFAAMLAHHGVLLDQNTIVDQGPISQVIHSAHLETVYGIKFKRTQHDGGWFVFPELSD